MYDLWIFVFLYVGVLQNILLELTDHSQAVHLIVDALSSVLDVSPEHILCSLSLDFLDRDNGPVLVQVSLQLSMHSS